MTPQRKIVQSICNTVVDELFEARTLEGKSKPTVGMFTISGKAKDTKPVAQWLSDITKNLEGADALTIAEACAVIVTNPTIMEKLKTFYGVTIKFNVSNIQSTLNGKVE